MSDPIRVAVIDDHPIVRDGIVAVIGTQAEMHVVQACSGIEDLIQVPDAVVLDWEIPKLQGPPAIAVLRERFPSAAVVIFSAYGGEERVRAAFDSGARAYVLKGSPADELLHAIRTCVQGGTLLGNGLERPLMSGDRPTPRENEVLQLLARGYTNAQIAQRLRISERTVKFHVTSLFARLGAKRRTQAIAIARERGLLPS
jgi:DNA-binding NarL/FixJ family response regulator